MLQPEVATPLYPSSRAGQRHPLQLRLPDRPHAPPDRLQGPTHAVLWFESWQDRFGRHGATGSTGRL